MDKQHLHKKLQEKLGKEKVLTLPGELASYSYDAGIYSFVNSFEPDAAVLAKSVEDVVNTLAIAHDFQVPVVPRGGASGQAGGTISQNGGICLDLSSWKDIQIYPEDFQAVVRPGVTLAELNKTLEPHGLYIPPDPSSGAAATFGGMVANNSAGQRSLKYGAMNDYILGLEVVLPQGDVVVLGGEGSRTVKNVSGLDLKTGLFIGSEGILGVIVGVRLKAVPIPPARAGMFFLSSDKNQIPKLIRDLYHAKVVFSACEFVNVQASAEEAVKKNLEKAPLPEHLEFVLLMEFEGNPAGVAWELEVAKKFVTPLQGTYMIADDAKDMELLWWLLDEAEGGVSVSRSGARRRPGAEDLVFPPSRLIEAIEGLQAITQKYGMSCLNFGHAALGNIHTNILVNIDDPEEFKLVEDAVRDSHLLALELGGSTCGEHGNGLLRQQFIEQEHGPAIKIMESIKNILDPDCILNPGKILKKDRR